MQTKRGRCEHGQGLWEIEGERSFELGDQLDGGDEGEGEKRMASGSWALATTGTEGTGWGKGRLTNMFTLMCPERSRARAWENRSREI